MKKLIAGLLAVVSFTAYANNIELIAPFPPGGAVDFVARAMQKSLNQKLDNETIVVNKPGAEGRIAVKYALQQPQNSNTLILFSTSLAFNRVIFNDPGYSFDDFDVIGPLVTVPAMFAVSNQSGIKDFQDFIRVAKTKKLNCGTSNSASLFIGRYMLKQLNLTNVEIVTFKGTGEVTTNLIGGNIDCSIDAMQTYLPLHKDNKLKIIALGDSFNDPALKGVKLFSDFVPDARFNNWYSVGIPKNSQAVNSVAITRALRNLHNDKTFVTTISGANLVSVQPPPSGNTFIDREYKKYEELRKTVGIEKTN